MTVTTVVGCSAGESCDGHGDAGEVSMMQRPTAGVLDYSFLSIESLDELPAKLQLTVGGGPPAEDGNDDSQTRRAKVSAVNLANNGLLQVGGLDDAISEIVIDPFAKLRWINLSFNSIVSIGNCFVKFHELSVLYLHANKISDLGTIKMLQKQPNLRALTLHGNPLAAQPHYRKYVVHMIPSLQRHDFTPITSEDRDSCGVLSTLFQKVARSSRGTTLQELVSPKTTR